MKKWIESRERGPYAYGLLLMVIRKIMSPSAKSEEPDCGYGWRDAVN
ncbi:hypothetical protein MKX67_03085 [Cytobacillus sp. FSL W7-1323]